MLPTLTKKQDHVLQFIANFAREHGFPPSVREIGAALGGIKSSTVAQHIKVLIKKGRIERGSSRARDIRLPSGLSTYGLAGAGMRGHPLFGRVPAGPPNVIDEQIEDVVWLDNSVSRSKDSYLIRVKGDSMIGAGILDKDLLIVRPQKNADSGNIVVAITPDGDGTVKKLVRKDGKIFLEAANPNYPPIAEPFEVAGRVVGLIRRF